MRSITQIMLEEIFIKAIDLSHDKNQVLGAYMDGDYYITLKQLQDILKVYVD